MLQNLNGFSDHLYDRNSLGKKGYCFLCPKKSNIKTSREGISTEYLFPMTLQSNKEILMKVLKKQAPKRERFRGKQTNWWCKDCKKFICQDC